MTATHRILFETSMHFQHCIGNLDEALRLNLELLIRSLRVDRATVFLLDEKKSALISRRIATIHGEMGEGGESLLYDNSGSGFSRALDLGKTVISPEYSIYLPLLHHGKKLGILRADNFFSRERIRVSDVRVLEKLAGIFSTGISNAIAHQHFKHQVKKLTALTRIGTAITASLKLNEILKLALSSLIKDLGYDRAQVYLFDDTLERISENLSIDFRGTVRKLDDVSHIAPFLESLLFETKPSFLSRKFSSQLIAYIPLRSKEESIGLLIVDNLFTRQTLTPYDLSFLGILAGHLTAIIENSRLFERVEKLSVTDSLTGLFNHRYFYERLNEELTRADRFNGSLALIMLDIDYFKKFNDTFGHQAGDAVLKTVTRIILENIRSVDIASRYGGEEIAIILPETDARSAESIAERIRQGIEQYTFRIKNNEPRLTVSIGLVCYPGDTLVKPDLVHKADLALYWVKNHGRNAVCTYSRCKELE